MTGRIIQMPGGDHREIQSLLPWYQVGGLDDEQRAKVEAHVSHCAECQADLALESYLSTSIIGLPVEAGVPDVEHGWRRMSADLDRAPPVRSPFAALTAWLGGRRPTAPSPRREPPWLRWALAAQFGLLLVLGVALWGAAQPARYHVLGSAPAPAVGNIVVIFRPETAEKDFREILRSTNARLVDGPTVADAYLVRVDPAERPKALARLRRHAQVILAEPVDNEARR